MPDDVRWQQRFDNFCKAFKQLEAAVSLYNARSLSEIETQGLIKVYEFTLGLAWNLLKDYLESTGMTGIIGSKNAIRQAFKNGLLEDGQPWLDMVEDRNIVSHTYNEGVAVSLAKKVAENYFADFQKLQRRFAGLLEQQ